MSFGERLLGLRNGAKLSREALGNQVGISARSIENYEKGESVPDLNVLVKLARVLKTTGAYMIGDTNDPSPEAITLPRGTVDRIMSTPFRASHNREKMKEMTDEEILAALKRVHEKQILIDLEEEYLKELERRKGNNS